MFVIQRTGSMIQAFGSESHPCFNLPPRRVVRCLQTSQELQSHGLVGLITLRSHRVVLLVIVGRIHEIRSELELSQIFARLLLPRLDWPIRRTRTYATLYTDELHNEYCHAKVKISRGFTGRPW